MKAEIDELAQQASSARESRNWHEAAECYEKMLALELTQFDRAKMLANLMQMQEKDGRIEKAIRSGEQALQLVQEYSLYQSMEGAHLRGFLTGALARLKGEPFPRRPIVPLLSAYLLGALLGAYFGSKIQYQGITIRGEEWTDLRYGGAWIGSVLGWLLLTRVLYALPIPILAIASVVNLAVLCLILTSTSVKLGILAIVVLIVQIAFARSLYKGISSKWGRRVKE